MNFSLTATRALLVACLASIPLMPWPGSTEASVQENDGLTIYGTVMVPGTREPVSGARVRLLHVSPTLSEAAQGLGLGLFEAYLEGVTVTAGADGRFRFTGLDPGHYQLSPVFRGESEGLLTGLRKVVDLREDRPTPDVEIWMEPVSQITGTVLDANGDPVVGATVDAIWAGGPDHFGSRFLSLSENAITDEEGRYVLLAQPGEYRLRIRSLVPSTNTGIGTQYYPGVFNPEEAIPMRVLPGIDLPGIRVSLSGDDVFRVRFRMPLPEYASGAPEPLVSYLEAGTHLVEARIRSTGPDSTTSTTWDVALEAVEADTYLTPPLPPSDYEMLVAYSDDLKSALRRHDLTVNWAQLDPIARIRFTVNDRDVDLGTVPEDPKVSISGRVISRTTQGIVEIDLTGLGQISLFDSDFWSISNTTTVAQDGTFLVQGVYPGRFSFNFPSEGIPDGWRVASVRSGGRDVLREGLLVGGPVSLIEVVLTDDGARIEGVARDDDQSLVPDARIVLIPPPSRRSGNIRFPTAVADAAGVYMIDNIPPGDYRMLALDQGGSLDLSPYWERQEFLAEFERLGERVTADPGARMVINSETIPLFE